MSIFGRLVEGLLKCIIFVIDLINPINAIDILYKLLYRPSSAGRLEGHQARDQGTVVRVA